MGKRSLDDARTFGRSIQPTHDLQPEAGSADGDSVFAILDVNEIEADAQPKKITFTGVANVVGPLLTPTAIPAAGSNTQVQFNDGGFFGADGGLTYNKTTDALSAGAFIPTGSTVPTNGVYLPSANTVALSTNGNGRLFISSAGLVGIGTTSPSRLLTLYDAGTLSYLQLAHSGASGTSRGLELVLNSSDAEIINRENGPLVFRTNNTERARIDSSGRLLVGTSTARSNFFNSNFSALLQVETTSSTSFTSFIRNTDDTGSNGVILGKSRGTTLGSNTIVQNGDDTGFVSFQGADGTEFVETARILSAVDGTPGANDMPGRLVFSTTADGAASPTERMRITQNGRIGIGTTDTNGSASDGIGIQIHPNGYEQLIRSSGALLMLNRRTDDGELVTFFQDNIQEGSISVSGTTVSYNGAHLSRWSQLPSGVERTEILRGSVLSNIDEMCEWGEEDNEQLNRMKVSDVEGDKNVSGVFQAWDDGDETYTNDFYCAMTGDFIIRIAQGVTVERGDLLMSAGDGTAKPQDDDIIRSKTIAKVTSTNVSCTYPDGSYCVPCVLMAC